MSIIKDKFLAIAKSMAFALSNESDQLAVLTKQLNTSIEDGDYENIKALVVKHDAIKLEVLKGLFSPAKDEKEKIDKCDFRKYLINDAIENKDKALLKFTLEEVKGIKITFRLIERCVQTNDLGLVSCVLNKAREEKIHFRSLLPFNNPEGYSDVLAIAVENENLYMLQTLQKSLGRPTINVEKAFIASVKKENEELINYIGKNNGKYLQPESYTEAIKISKVNNNEKIVNLLVSMKEQSLLKQSQSNVIKLPNKEQCLENIQNIKINEEKIGKIDVEPIRNKLVMNC